MTTPTPDPETLDRFISCANCGTYSRLVVCGKCGRETESGILPLDSPLRHQSLASPSVARDAWVSDGGKHEHCAFCGNHRIAGTEGQHADDCAAVARDAAPDLDTPVSLADAINRLRSLVRSEAGHIAYFDDELNYVVEAAKRSRDAAPETTHRSKWCRTGKDAESHGWCANRNTDETRCKCPCHRLKPRNHASIKAWLTPDAPACEQHGVMVADDDSGRSWHCAVCSNTEPPSTGPRDAAPGCIACGEANQGGYEVENGPGPFCATCWDKLAEACVARDAGPETKNEGLREATTTGDFAGAPEHFRTDGGGLRTLRSVVTEGRGPRDASFSAESLDEKATYYEERYGSGETVQMLRYAASLAREVEAVYALGKGPIDHARATPLAQWVKTRFVHVEDYNALASEVETLRSQIEVYRQASAHAARQQG